MSCISPIEYENTNEINNIPLRTIIPMEEYNEPPISLEQTSYQWASRMHPQSVPISTQPVADGNILSPRNEMHFTSGIPMDKCYSIGTNRANRTNGRVECTPTQPLADGRCVSPIEYQWNTTCSNGRVECTPTQTEANRNNLSPSNEMHFTNRIPIE